MTKELEERLAELEKEVAKSRAMKKRWEIRFSKQSLRIVSILGATVVIAAGFLFWSYRYGNTNDELPGTVMSQADFPIYFYREVMPGGFSLDAKRTTFKNGILVFQLTSTDAKKTVVFTEQMLGNYDFSSLQGDKEFKTPYGQAFITDGETRTTGTLFTDDKTWILMNAPTPIGADAMQSLINGLRPIRREN